MNELASESLMQNELASEPMVENELAGESLVLGELAGELSLLGELAGESVERCRAAEHAKRQGSRHRACEVAA